MPIETEAQLRAIYGEPSERAVKKQLDHLDRHCRRFIALSPFLLVATSDGADLDVSPKGDRPGFVQVESDAALLIPDWPGNSRIDGLRNILKHGQVGLIFLIPNVRETLRVNGPATIHDDADLLARFKTDKGRLPLTVLRVEAREVFLHCAKAFLRSGLWDKSTWPEREALPSMGEMIRDHTKTDGVGETDEVMIERYRNVLY